MNFSSFNRKMPRLGFYSSCRRSIQFPFKELFRPSVVCAHVCVCVLLLCVRRAINQTRTRKTVEARNPIATISANRTKAKTNVMSLGDKASHGFATMPPSTREKGKAPQVNSYIFHLSWVFYTILFQFVNKRFANICSPRRPARTSFLFLVYFFVVQSHHNAPNQKVS